MTNLITMREIDQFMSDYKPSYVPILPLFTPGAVTYDVTVGKVNFQRSEAIGDLESKFLGPKDTEMHQILAKEGSKAFKKYFLGSQFIQSELQDQRGYESVVAQVLDVHNKQADKIFFTGDGTSDGTVLNNGLFYSGDPNHVTNSSVEVAKATDGSHLASLYATIGGLISDAQETDGRIAVMAYGSTVLPKWNGLFPTSNVPFVKSMQDGYEGVTFMKIPASLGLSGDGVLIVNLDQVQLHMSILPRVDGQGINQEKKYAWTNFLMGSTMLDVKALGAVTKQPLTFAA